MLCPHCDEIIDSGASICPVCGKHTGAGKSSPPKKKSSKIIAVVVLAAAVALMAVIMITGGLGMAPDMGTDSDKNVYRASYGVGTVPTTVDMVSGYGIDVTFLPGTGGDHHAKTAAFITHIEALITATQMPNRLRDHGIQICP